MRAVAGLVFLVTLLSGFAYGEEEVEEERVTDVDGVEHECGVGPGLSPCRDAEGETYAHEVDPNYVGLDSDAQLEQSAEAVRKESPQQLEKTIEGFEDHD